MLPVNAWSPSTVDIGVVNALPGAWKCHAQGFLVFTCVDSRCRMKWHIHFRITLLALLSAYCVIAADPEALLARADHLVEIGNSIKARPLYAEAEQEFHAREDRRNELYAK